MRFLTIFMFQGNRKGYRGSIMEGGAGERI